MIFKEIDNTKEVEAICHYSLIYRNELDWGRIVERLSLNGKQTWTRS